MKRVKDALLPIPVKLEPNPDPSPRKQQRGAGKRTASIVIIRVDPYRRSVSAMRFKCGRDATPEVRRIVRQQEVGHYKFPRVDADGRDEQIPLVVAAGLNVSKKNSGWRLKSGQDTAGIGILFGMGPGGGMVDVPVSVAWVNRMISWLDGEQVDD